MATQRYIDLKKEEKRKEIERLSKITFESNSIEFLNNYKKTEIKIVELDTNILDRLNQYAFEIQKSNKDLYSYQITKSEIKAVITFKRKDNSIFIKTIKIKNNKILSID